MSLAGSIIRWSLNHIPRTALQRVAGWAIPVVGVFYRGHARCCPVCGASWRRFMPYGYASERAEALCPKCLSLERHRLLWLYLSQERTMLEGCPQLLHIAPEVCLMRRIKPLYKANHCEERYITADLESPIAKLHFDVRNIPLEDESIDLLICNHLLEHIDDEPRALAELRRILRKGGRGIVLAPVDLSRETTFEDATICTAEQRQEFYGQYDHFRLYGRDYVKRLAAAGFEVEDIDYASTLTQDERIRYGLSDEHIYIIRRPND